MTATVPPELQRQLAAAAAATDGSPAALDRVAADNGMSLRELASVVGKSRSLIRSVTPPAGEVDSATSPLPAVIRAAPAAERLSTALTSAPALNLTTGKPVPKKPKDKPADPRDPDLIAAGRASTRKRTAALADRIAADLDRLRELVDAESAEAAAEAAAAKEQAAAAAEVARLQAQLDAAKARLKPTTGPRRSSTAAAAPRGGVNAADVRAWARDNGYTVPSRGRLPTHITDAYNKDRP
jgi:hypothetical protein